MEQEQFPATYECTFCRKVHRRSRRATTKEPLYDLHIEYRPGGARAVN